MGHESFRFMGQLACKYEYGPLPGNCGVDVAYDVDFYPLPIGSTKEQFYKALVHSWVNLFLFERTAGASGEYENDRCTGVIMISDAVPGAKGFLSLSDLAKTLKLEGSASYHNSNSGNKIKVWYIPVDLDRDEIDERLGEID